MQPETKHQALYCLFSCDTFGLILERGFETARTLVERDTTVQYVKYKINSCCTVGAAGRLISRALHESVTSLI